MEPCFVMNGLYFSFMFDGCLYFSISAYAALKWTSGAIDATRVTLAFVTMSQIATWPITSYGEARDKFPAPHAPINRFGKKNLFHFNIEIEKPSHWFNFWTSVILSVWPNNDNHYNFSVFTHFSFSSENIRSCWYSRGSRYATEIHFFLPLSAFIFHRKPNGWPLNKMKKIKR